MGEAHLDDAAPLTARRNRLDSILNLTLGFLVSAVLLVATWFGVSVWQMRQTTALSTPAHRLVETVKDQVRRAPNNLNLRIELGRAYATIGELDAAVEQLENALKIDPDSPEAYYYLARVAMLEQDNDAARKYFLKVIELTEEDQYAGVNPRREESFYGLGLIAIDDEEYEDAIGYLKAATRIRKDASDTYYQMARAYWGLGEAEAAHEQIQIAVTFDPNFARALYLNGEIYLEEKDEINASYWFYRASQADPDAEMPQEALAYFGTAEERVELGRAALASGDVDKALEHALIATNIAPDEWSAHAFHAEVLVKRGNTVDAVKVYKKALETAPESEKTAIETEIGRLEAAGK